MDFFPLCGVCSRPQRMSTSLSCGHSFCQNCVLTLPSRSFKLLLSDKTTGKPFLSTNGPERICRKCPTCRRDGYYLVSPNFSVRWLEEKLSEQAMPLPLPLPKNNFNADRPPRESDNVLIGYRKLSLWLYNGLPFVCEKEGVESKWGLLTPPINFARINSVCNSRKRARVVVDLSDEKTESPL